MANHKSAIKRHRQSLKRRSRNRLVKGSIRGAIKEVHGAVVDAGADKTEALKLAKANLVAAEKLIASAASKKVLHARSASRKISRLAKLVNTLQNATA
jgi:small subunit ribosomal protein S20